MGITEWPTGSGHGIPRDGTSVPHSAYTCVSLGPQTSP